MKTEGMSSSEEHVEDRRGRGGRAGFPIGVGTGAKLGIPGIILAILAVVLGSQFGGGGGSGGLSLPDIFNQLQPAAPADPASGSVPGAPDARTDSRQFTIQVFNDVQAFWANQLGASYSPATLVLFSGGTRSGCGAASSASGPFYCPGDRRVYIDLSFFDELAARFQAPGDFAQAYVIAHEVGHHVQTVTGVEAAVRRKQQQDRSQANELSVRLELQADCFAGVWARSVYGRLESGDLREALDAASAVGDDRLQEQASGRVNPDTFTHGTSEQRQKWFTRGYESGDAGQCTSVEDGP